jgi:pimeloyl-ACP methyl ester carboxylesterase
LLILWFQDAKTENEIAKLKIPTLILHGNKDIIVLPGNGKILAENIHHSKLLRWQDGSHAMLFQYPESIASEINDFLGSS